MAHSVTLPRLAALGAVALWGVSFVATKAALSEASPLTVVFTRFALGTAVLAIILRLRGLSVVPPREAWPALAAMGFVGIFVHQLLQVHGLALTTAVRTGWLIGLIPIWSAVLSAVTLRERFGGQKILGLAVGTVGAVLVVTKGELGWDVLALPATRGDLLILASTVNWAIYTVLGHGTLRRLGSARASAASMLLGWLMLAPLFARTSGWRELPGLSAVGIGCILFLGIGCSGLGYLFWYAALERLEASRVAAFLYLEPLVTLATAVTLLREPVSWTTLAGGALVLGGVWVVQHAPGGRPT
jgi:drug/metabolite transporter (DMT)-like permease